MAVLSCALCFTETSMNFHKALIDQCSVEIETFGGAFSGLYRESSINILNPPRPTHLGRVVDYCSWEKNRFSVKIWVKQMQHVWWIPWLVIFHSSFLSERKIDSIVFLRDDDPSSDVIWFLWTLEEKKSLRIPIIKSPACQSIIEPPVFVVIQKHARQVFSDQSIWASPFFAPFAMRNSEERLPKQIFKWHMWWT